MERNTLYPLKFKPILVNKIWGGRRIPEILAKGLNHSGSIGESWEISGVKESVSVVKTGYLSGRNLNWVIKNYGENLLGKHYKGPETQFPLLIKFLDANDDLSVQVHPNDEQAELAGERRGKTEMWYILDSDEDAYIYNGFNRKMDKNTLRQTIENGTTIDFLNKIPVKSGDSFYIPAGRIHSIGTGTFLAEIQQSSDTTYRVYDFNRKDAEGNTRELHLDSSLGVMDYGKLEKAKIIKKRLSETKSELVKSPFFSTNVINTINPLFEKNDTNNFRIIICNQGSAYLHTEGIKTSLIKGDCVLIPSSCTTFFVLPGKNGVEYLETTID